METRHFSIPVWVAAIVATLFASSALAQFDSVKRTPYTTNNTATVDARVASLGSGITNGVRLPNPVVTNWMSFPFTGDSGSGAFKLSVTEDIWSFITELTSDSTNTMLQFTPPSTVRLSSLAAAPGFVQSGALGALSTTKDLSTGTNYYATNLVSRAIHSTNANNGLVIDASKQYQGFSTNQPYAVSGFSGLVSGARHVFAMFVDNTSASNITWTAPANCHFPTNGIATNAMTIPAGQEMWVSFEIRPNLRTNFSNFLIP